MLEALATSRVPEKLEAHIARTFTRLDEEDARCVVGEAIDSLYERAVVPYLFKAAQTSRTTHGRSSWRFSSMSPSSASMTWVTTMATTTKGRTRKRCFGDS